MTREDIRDQLEKIVNVYEKFTMTKPLFEIWVNSFKEYDKKLFERAVDEAILNEEYTPNIATINRYYKQIEEARKVMISKARESYNRAVYALGCEKNVDDYKEYLEWLATVPAEERIEIAEKFSYDVVSHANSCMTSGKPIKTFKELLEEVKC